MILLKKNRKKIENILADELKEENEMNMSSDEKDESKFITEYIIQAVIRKKLLFNKRPRPIVS